MLFIKTIFQSLKKAIRSVVIISLLFIILLTTIFLFTTEQENTYNRRVGSELESIANLKAKEISKWRNEHISDFQVRIKNAPLIRRFIEFLSTGKDPNGELLDWMKSNVSKKDYCKIMLYNADKKIRYSYPETDSGYTEESYLKSGLDSTLLTDLYINKTNKLPQMDLIMPLLEKNRNAKKLKGYLVFRVDASDYFFPLVQTWPTPSRTAETLLFRQEGDSIIFLNELRHAKNTALKLKFSIKDNPNLAAIRGLKGERSILQAVDYRSVPVLACIRPIPKSPWYIVAKIDQAEVDSPRRNLWYNFYLGLSILIIFSGVMLILARRTERNAHFRKLYSLEKEKQKLAVRYDNLTRYANDIILVCDSSLRIIDANNRAIKSYGYKREDFIDLNMNDFATENMPITEINEDTGKIPDAGITFETMHKKKDGSIFPVEVSAQIIQVEEEQQYFFIIRDITERKKEEQRTKSLSDILENSVNEVYVFDACSLKFLYLNNAAIKNLGYDIREIKTITPVDIKPEYTQESFLSAIKPLLSGETKLINFETVHQRKNGTTYNVEVHLQLTNYEGIKAFAAIILDVTERKNAEEAIKEMRLFNDNLIQSANALIVGVDVNGKLTIFNKMAEKVSGYTIEELKDKNWFEVVVPKDKYPYVWERFSRIESEGFPDNFENPILTKSGEERIISWNNTEVYSYGKIAGTVSFGIDITERKRVEEALRESEYFFKESQRAAFTGSYKFDFTTGFWESSEVLDQIFGIDKNFIRNIESWVDIIHQDDKEMMDNYLREDVFMKRNTFDKEYRIKRKSDNEIRWMHGLGQLEIDDHGNVISMIGTIQDVTDRKLAEEVIHENEKRFRTLINNLQAGIVVHAPNTEVLLSNPMAATLLGLTEDQMIGKTAIDPAWHFIREDGSPLPFDEYPVNEVVSGKDVLGKVRGIAHPDRDIPTWVICNGYSVRNRDNSIAQIIITFIDITERKLAEELILESEERFRRLYEDATIGLYRTTPSGKILMANKTLINMLGCSSFEEISNRNLEKDSFEPSYLRKQFRDLLERDGEIKGLEAEWNLNNGKTITVQENVKVIRDNNGNPLYYDGIVEDITERKHAEELIRESEERFRTLFENMTEGVALHEVIYDQFGNAVDYKILSINPAYRKHTGITNEQVVGLLASKAYGVDPPPYLNEYSSVAETGTPYWFETFFPPLEKHFRISVFSPRQGQFATVFEDITNAKKREDELKQRNDEMARFTYTVSHDLKSPLVTIKTFLGYLEEDIKKNDEASRKKDIEFIQNAAQKMSNLLDELLDLSRIGRKTAPFTETPFGFIVQEALQIVAGQLAKRGVKVEVTKEHLLLYCEHQRMVEVFQNLIDNAIKFMGDQPEPLIIIDAMKEQDEYVFSVKDNGIGIDPKYHKRIFNIFEKLNPQTGGTGIGLAAVNRIIEYHGGKIRVESEGLGKGTTFKFTIGKVIPEKKA